MHAVCVAVLLAGGCARPAGAGAQAPRARAIRASVALQQDIGFASGRNVCAREAQLSRGYACFREDGTQYHGNPLPDLTPAATRPEAATTRALLGLDYLLFGNWTLGLRGGLALRGLGPRQDGAAAPEPLWFHGEMRGAYWFGSAPFARTGFRFGAFLTGGIAQVDTAWRVSVEEDLTKPRPVAQPNNPPRQSLEVYRKSGTGFAGGGLTGAYAFRDWGAVFLEMKVMVLFPSDGAALSPVIGYEHAF